MSLKYLPVTYYGMFGHSTDSLSVIKNFNQIYAPVDGGIYTKEEILENNPDATILTLEVKPNLAYKCFKPAGDNRWLMKGYGFICSSDSRFARQYGSCAIPLHDRYEG